MGEFEGEETPFCREQKGGLPSQKTQWVLSLERPADVQTDVDGGGLVAEELAARVELRKDAVAVIQAYAPLKEQGVLPKSTFDV